MVKMVEKKFYLEYQLAENYVDKFFQYIQKSQWKRERMAPAFHIDDFSLDSKTFLRFPIFF